MDWYCFKDETAMVDTDVELKYVARDNYSRNFTFKGMKCPKCGTVFLREELAVGRLATAEGMAEGK